MKIQELKKIHSGKYYIYETEKPETEYKRFSACIGESDIAGLTVIGCNRNGIKTDFLKFRGDNAYSTWIIDGETEVPKHYEKVMTFAHWIKIFDDNEKTFSVRAKKIEIFRAGDYGCLIRLTF